MNHEGRPSRNETEGSIEQLFEREIKKALSPTWPKTVQELLPGYLPEKTSSELNYEERAQYKIAYGVLKEMIENNEIESIVEETEIARPLDPSAASGAVSRPKFKLKSYGGKKSRNEGLAWQGNPVADLEP